MTPAGRRFSIAHVALIVPWVALVIDAWSSIGDNSFLWHIRAGELQMERASVLTQDPFSFTMMGEEWLTQSWLAELLYGWAEGFSGLGFVPAMILGVSTLAFIGIGLIAYRHSQSVPGTAFVLVLSTLLLISFLVPRPVLFSYLLFVLVILAWDRPGARWTTPLLFWIWASVHGSFVIGLAYVGLTLIMRKEWKLMPSAVVAGLATLVTAHGIGVVEMLLNFGEARDALTFISEWRRPTLDSPVFIAFVGGIAFVVVGAFRQLISPRHLWVLIPFLALGLTSLRAVPPAWIAILPLVSVSLWGLSIGSQKRLGARPALIFGLVVLMMPFLLIEGSELDSERLPVDASHELADVPTFHNDVVGGYLIWAEGPERLVFLDDRAELYLSRMQEFVEVRDGEADWRPVFERDGIEQALLRKDVELVDELASAGWETEYEDEEFLVMRP